MIAKLSHLFKSKKTPAEPKPASRETPTLPLANRQKKSPISDELINLQLRLPQLAVSCAQSVGKQRDHNEDSILAISVLSSNNGGYLPIGLYIVADGMGGHKNGELASKLAVQTIAHTVIENIFLPALNSGPTPPTTPIQEILEQSVHKAHQTITKEVPGGGTTLTTVLIVGQQMSIAHVGDTRLYHINSDGNMETLTRDHSLVRRMIELGHLTEEEASVHPQRNVLYRALGQGEPFNPDISTQPLPQSGYLLLCSDGLWGVVGQTEIANIVQSSKSQEIACQSLVDAANNAGGPDNISAILIRIPD